MKKRTKSEKFWYSHIKNNKKVFVFDRAKLSDFLEVIGYRKLTSFGIINTILLEKNVAYLKTPMDVYIDVLNHIKLQNNDTLRACFIQQGENLLITKKAILGALPEIELDKYLDTKEKVKLFYPNKIITITSDKIKTQSYKKLTNHYILSDQLINRKYEVSDNKESDFETFLNLATENNEHFISVCTALGYLISSYKNPSITKAVIITDILSQLKNEAFGRSGKGLLVKALSHIINVVEYNGKVTDLSNDKFVFQNVTLSTALIVLQDVTMNFLFESLFSSLTDVLSIEKKHKDKINIPYQYSPKIALTTNYTIPQDTDSFRDRKYLLTLNNFFNSGNKPEKHLGKLLFDWSNEEWARFDKFMIHCVQLFLKNGLVEYNNPQLNLRKLINMTSNEFVDVMNSEFNVLNKYWKLKDIALRFQLKSRDTSVRSRVISEWMKFYASFKGYKVDKRESGGITKICFIDS